MGKLSGNFSQPVGVELLSQNDSGVKQASYNTVKSFMNKNQKDLKIKIRSTFYLVQSIPPISGLLVHVIEWMKNNQAKVEEKRFIGY